MIMTRSDVSNEPGVCDAASKGRERPHRPQRGVAVRQTLDAVVEVRGARGTRTVRLSELYRLPNDTPHMETVLEPGEAITGITVPATTTGWRSHYLKVRDRASFEFALVAAGVALDMDGNRIRQARVALGGVGTKPWRLPNVESALAGAEGAQGHGHNDFKIELMQRAIVRAVEIAGARA